MKRAGSSSIPDTVPYPNGPWSAGQQGDFVGSCTASGNSTTGYCTCALGWAMGTYPDPSSLADGDLIAAGVTADDHHDEVPGCEGK